MCINRARATKKNTLKKKSCNKLVGCRVAIFKENFYG